MVLLTFIYETERETDALPTELILLTFFGQICPKTLGFFNNFLIKTLQQTFFHKLYLSYKKATLTYVSGSVQLHSVE